jgi:hypothetical protein
MDILERIDNYLNEKKVKYPKIMKIINKHFIKNQEKLYKLVVDEYEEMGDNPNDATQRDIFEIADASGIEDYKD